MCILSPTIHLFSRILLQLVKSDWLGLSLSISHRSRGDYRYILTEPRNGEVNITIIMRVNLMHAHVNLMQLLEAFFRL